MSALEGLAADDLFGMSAAGLLDRTAELVRARNRIDAELARTVRRAELAQAPEHDGLKTMASWLRGHARLSPAAAGQLVRNGRALESLPAVAAGCSAGLITAEQVAVMAKVTRPEQLSAAADQGVEIAEVAAVLADIAAARQHGQLGRVVGHYLARLDPDGPEPDPTEGRSISRARHSDGTVSLRGQLDAVGGEKLAAALESFVQADRPAGDRRTRAPRNSATPLCNGPTTRLPPQSCRSCARSSRTCWSPSEWPTWSTRPPDPAPPTPDSVPPSPPPGPAGWPATAPSPG